MAKNIYLTYIKAPRVFRRWDFILNNIIIPLSPFADISDLEKTDFAEKSDLRVLPNNKAGRSKNNFLSPKIYINIYYVNKHETWSNLEND